MEKCVIDKLVVKNKTKIVYLIMDGVGGLKIEGKAGTELQVANTPNMDDLAKRSLCGVMDPIAPGVTPGSGPAHLALFGYDPVSCNIGRGILSALGIDFKLTEKDVAARVNFATLDENGNVTDRRAGRISSEENQRLCKKITDNVKLSSDVEFIITTVSEHRALLVLRGDGLYDNIAETDPQKTGVPPVEPDALDEKSQKLSKILKKLISKIRDVLKDEPKANMILARGYANHVVYPSMTERFGIKCLAIAQYPMYKGLARLVGMDIAPQPPTIEDEVKLLKEHYDQYDFFFIHIKKTDSYGEDGNFDAKVHMIEEVDKLIPDIEALKPDVLVITGDHSTPSMLASHSWHPVPVLLNAATARVDEVDKFDEISCLRGGISRMATLHLTSLALAHAGRLAKFGA